MREELAKFHGLRRTFKGTFERSGSRSGYKHPLVTVLLKDVVDVKSGKTVTDHLWFTMGKQFNEADLHEGNVIQFEARVTRYEKGYQGRQDEDDYDFKPVEIDYRLSFPTQVKNLSANNVGSSSKPLGIVVSTVNGVGYVHGVDHGSHQQTDPSLERTCHMCRWRKACGFIKGRRQWWETCNQFQIDLELLKSKVEITLAKRTTVQIKGGGSP